MTKGRVEAEHPGGTAAYELFISPLESFLVISQVEMISYIAQQIPPIFPPIPLSSSPSIWPCASLPLDQMRNNPEGSFCMGVCVLACLPFLAALPPHVLFCIYLGRRQIGCLKPLKPLQTLVPWWDHEKQLLLFQLLHHHDQVEKWDNGSDVKQHRANSCVFVNCSQVFKECNAPWS